LGAIGTIWPLGGLAPRRRPSARGLLQSIPISGGYSGRGASAGLGAWPATAPPPSLHALMVDPGHLPLQDTVSDWVNRAGLSPCAKALGRGLAECSMLRKSGYRSMPAIARRVKTDWQVGR